MSQKTWTLLDTQKNIYLETLDLSANYRIRKTRLYGGLQDGLDVIEIDNGVLRIVICPTRGMGILKIHKGPLEIKWDAPANGPIHPKFVPLSEQSGLGWLDGFSEWLVRCGLDSNGSPDFNENGTLIHGLHGRIANTPARKVELTIDEDTGQITLEGTVEESRLFFKHLELKTVYTTFVGESGFTMKDTVTNLSSEDGEFELLYHINTGQPLASPGARIIVPYKTLAPRNPESAAELKTWNTCDPERPGSPEVVYFIESAPDTEYDKGRSSAMLISEDEKSAFLMRFSESQIPYFCVWKCRLAAQDGYVIGFEPCLNFPNPKSFEKSQGRVTPLAAKQSREFDFRFDFLSDRGLIRQESQRLEALQGRTHATVEPAPRKAWSG